MSELKSSINKVQLVGTLKEINLEEVTDEAILKNGKGAEKKVTCKKIVKKAFGSPSVTVEVTVNGKTSDIGVDFFNTAEKKLDDNGDIVDNPKFKAMQTVLTTYVPKSKNADGATRVKVDGMMGVNEYVDKVTYEYKSFAQINAFQISSTNVPEEDMADAEISGVIRTIIPEVRGENAEETGRLKVELYTFNSNGATYPINLIVEEDIASDFNSYYECGQSVKLYYEIVSKQIGGVKKQVSGGFGRRDSKIVDGFTVREFSVFRGEDPFEEESDYYVSIDTMKTAMNERQIMIDTKIAEKKNGTATTSAKPRGASTNAPSNPFGNSAPTQSSAPKASPF